MKNKNIIVTVLLLILVGAGSFFGGMKYQQSKTASLFGQFAGGRNTNNPQGRTGQNALRNGAGFRPIAGQILSMDSKSITVKMTDGSSKIVILSDKTIYNKTQESSLTDLKVGDNISVFGTTNSDGSVTAQNLQTGIMFRGNGDGPTPGQRQ
jgi:hypothetical protein